MITVKDCVNAVEQFLKEEGFTVDRYYDALFVDLKYGEFGFEYTTLSIDVDDYISVHPPGTARLLRVPLSHPDSFQMLADVIRFCHRELLARGIDDMWNSHWRLGPPKPVISTNPCCEL